MSEATSHSQAQRRFWGLAAALAASATALALTGCTGGGSNGGSVTSSPTPTPTTQAVSQTQVIPAAGATVSLAPTASSTLSLAFPAGAVPAGTSVTITIIPENQLPVALTHAVTAKPHFTPNVGNKYVIAFQLTAANLTAFQSLVTLAGGIGLTTLPANTVLNVAQLQGGTYVDVATVTTTAQGGFTQQAASAVLKGITGPGTYVVYQPAQGTSTAVANFGIALLADDGNGTGSAFAALQAVNLLDPSGSPLGTPVVTPLNFSGASDLDGQALTPDGKQGVLVDGGNVVRFFSQTGAAGAYTVSPTTLDISLYGGDGDSVAILPTGDEAVVSGDSTQLLLISGITGGNPQTAATIQVPGRRDGLVISNDGRVMLARGPSGLTTFSVTPAAPTVGPLGGQVSHAFTQTRDDVGEGSVGIEDGRDGMAFSPADSSRAVVLGTSAGGSTVVSLLTGLPNSYAVSQARLQLPAAQPYTAAGLHDSHARPNVALTGVGRTQAVSVTPDGKSAIVGTDAGLVLVSGVNTGSLAQVGAVFSPSFTVAGTSYALTQVTTVGITLDGKYVVACSQQPSAGQGTLLLIPILYTNGAASGFGSAVSQINAVAVPYNDQILMH